MSNTQREDQPAPLPEFRPDQVVAIEDLQTLIGELTIKNMLLGKENAGLKRELARLQGEADES